MRCKTFCYAVLLIAGTMLAGAAAGEDQQVQAQARQAPVAKADSQQGSATGGATRARWRWEPCRELKRFLGARFRATPTTCARRSANLSTIWRTGWTG